MTNIQSAWWIIYCKSGKDIVFLIIKRQSLSKKIERVAPKGKIKVWELPQEAALREVVEETGLQHNKLYISKELGTVGFEYGELKTYKEVTYFLIEYLGHMDDVQLQDQEWFLGIHKRAKISDVLNLITFQNLRLLYKQAYDNITHQPN